MESRGQETDAQRLDRLSHVHSAALSFGKDTSEHVIGDTLLQKSEDGEGPQLRSGQRVASCRSTRALRIRAFGLLRTASHCVQTVSI